MHNTLNYIISELQFYGNKMSSSALDNCLFCKCNMLECGCTGVCDGDTLLPNDFLSNFVSPYTSNSNLSKCHYDVTCSEHCQTVGDFIDDACDVCKSHVKYCSKCKLLGHKLMCKHFNKTSIIDILEDAIDDDLVDLNRNPHEFYGCKHDGSIVYYSRQEIADIFSITLKRLKLYHKIGMDIQRKIINYIFGKCNL